MTVDQGQRPTLASTANPQQGLRIEGSGALQQTSAGRFALPLKVIDNGKALGDGCLVLTFEGAATLYADIGRFLTCAPAPADNSGAGEEE
ncbi:hypothetical protein ACIP88_14480 [Streptomyces uncialis]|uniref:hypothetical protein n=1 Tax=Streptomyces uncialis TaxID=1048205 RepID=UPI00382234A6